MIVSHFSIMSILLFPDNFTRSPKGELARINTLTDYEVFIELQIIMEGRSYSWHSINQGLQAQVDDGVLIDEIIIHRWNFLCGEKRRWEHMERHSFICQRYNRGCLFSLTTIPMLAGLGKSYSL